MLIKSKINIINYFQSGIKRNNFIGVENEKFLFSKNFKQRASYKQTKDVLNYLIYKYKWKPVIEKKNLIGLKYGGKSITLEPGNQIELAGEKLKNIHQICSEGNIFLKQLLAACRKNDLEAISLGYDPYSKLKNTPKNPKERYKIMTKEMPKNGKLSLEMMYQTAGTQINLDYTSEKNFTKKFKLISYLTPLSIAVFANSPIKEHKLTKYLSYRSKVWQNTSRGGLPRVFLENMSFEKYADFAMKQSLLFVTSKNKIISGKGKNFEDFMNGNIQFNKNQYPNEKDLETHLSTIFTELRLKKYIEVRSLDACEWNCHCAGPAFYTGLAYGNLDEALHEIKNWKITDVLNAYYEAPKKGLKTEINNKSLRKWGKIFLTLSKKGLSKRNKTNKNKENESIYLKNVENIIKNNKTKAEETIENIFY